MECVTSGYDYSLDMGRIVVYRICRVRDVTFLTGSSGGSTGNLISLLQYPIQITACFMPSTPGCLCVWCLGWGVDTAWSELL